MRSKRQITTVSVHVGGEPSEIIIGGVLPPPGRTMFDRMQHMAKHQDHIRRFLMLEPRGSVTHCINLVTPSTHPDCAAGVIIMEPTEYVPMSGSNTIATVTVLLETGMIEMIEPVTRFNLDTAAGPIRIEAHCKDGECLKVELTNVPCFPIALDVPIEVEGFGTVMTDIAYGGMIYAIADAVSLGFSLEPREGRELSEAGEKLRRAAREQFPCRHPENPEIRDVTIVSLVQPFQGVGQASRNAVIVSPGRLDRSPTGTAMSARMAVLHARGQMKVGDMFVNQSVIRSSFEGRITAETTVAGRPAIIPSIAGRAWITGTHNYFLDPSDPYPEGYLLSDTWGVTGKAEQ
ncbi:MAG: proline racemase family protein [Parvibaculaceae bacterium]